MNNQEIKKAILKGKLFIYPTDTIYGLGCNALDKKAVEKIKELKRRDKDKPLSVIAPSLEWIKENLIVDVDLQKYLPGPYTIILKKRDSTFLNWVSNTESLGIRIPKHSFTKIIQEANVPFITTSINKSGEKPVAKLSEIPEEIKNKVDLIVEGRKMSGKPSTLIINGKLVERK